jgi:hypothetical protein
MSVTIRSRLAVAATLSLCLTSGIAVLGAESPSPMSSGQPAPAPSVGADTATDVLSGKAIGIVMITPPGASIPRDTPIIQGAQAAIEGSGATAAICEVAHLTRRQAHRGREVVDGLVVLMFFPGRFEVPGRLVERGLAVAIVGPPGSAPTDGTVLLREDPAVYGLEHGRAAGAWAATAWPDTDVIVNVRPASADPQDAYYQAVSAGILETLPTATILPPAFGAPADVEANLYTGAMQASMVAVPLAAGALGPSGGPVAIFPLGCPDPLPTDETFAGCIDLGYEVVGAAAVETVASILAGAETPDEMVANPSVEVMTAP